MKKEEEEKVEDLMKLCFGRIGEVSEDSPSSVSGMQVGDLVYQFGEADYFNNNGLAFVKSVVMNS